MPKTNIIVEKCGNVGQQEKMVSRKDPCHLAPCSLGTLVCSFIYHPRNIKRKRNWKVIFIVFDESY